MIAHFPDPYPGELLYSVFARFADRMHYPSLGATMVELFGKRYAVPGIELPNQIDSLLSRLPPGHSYTADSLIDHHTLFPLYAPFVRAENYQKLRDNMKGDAVRTTQLVSGINACRVPPPKTLRICPLCDQENKQKFGETYWHRVHQVPGVEVCPFHAVFLQGSSAFRRQQETRHNFISAEVAERSGTIVPVDHADSGQKVLLKIAKLTAQILEMPPDPAIRANLRARYIAGLWRKGLAHRKGTLCAAAARRLLLEFCPAETMRLLHCQLPDSQAYSGWLGALTHSKQQALAPIRHLLFIAWLDQPLQFFLTTEKVDDPFYVRFPCLNAVCEWFGKEVNNSLEFRTSKRVRGLKVYRCPHCQHASSRNQDASKVVRVIDFGTIWTNRLRSLWIDRNLSLSEIRKILAADPTTIRRRAASLGLPFPRPHKNAHRVRPPKTFPRRLPSEQIREGKKLKWLALRNRVRLNANRTTRRLHHSLYRWLRTYEPDWLQAHSLRGNRQTPQTEMVNWEARDKMLCAKISEAVQKIKARIDKPRRISFTRLGRELGMLATMQAHPEKLPKTLNAIATFIETREQFALRRLHNAVGHFIDTRYRPNWSELTKRAGINSGLYGRPHIAAEIQRALGTIEATFSNSSFRRQAA